MANPDHLAQLRSGRWNEWRAANPTLAPDLIEADLSGQDLRGLDLSKSHLRSAELVGARLDGAATGLTVRGPRPGAASRTSAHAGCGRVVRAGLKIIVGNETIADIDAVSHVPSKEYGGYDQGNSGSNEYQRKIEHGFNLIPL